MQTLKKKQNVNCSHQVDLKWKLAVWFHIGKVIAAKLHSPSFNLLADFTTIFVLMFTANWEHVVNQLKSNCTVQLSGLSLKTTSFPVFLHLQKLIPAFWSRCQKKQTDDVIADESNLYPVPWRLGLESRRDTRQDSQSCRAVVLRQIWIRPK